MAYQFNNHALPNSKKIRIANTLQHLFMSGGLNKKPAISNNSIQCTGDKKKDKPEDINWCICC